MLSTSFVKGAKTRKSQYKILLRYNLGKRYYIDAQKTKFNNNLFDSKYLAH